MVTDAFLKCVGLRITLISLRVYILSSHQSNTIERDELRQSKKSNRWMIKFAKNAFTTITS